MKYGENFENQSVPEWSLQNIDYNDLKHQIKLHTAKGQGTAIAIPGHQDVALQKFEDRFYAELCRQHDRVDLFVSSKANEIQRRLQYLSAKLRTLIVRCSTGSGLSLKRQRLFAKYQQQIVECGDDIRSLSRFVNAQAEAFRKILKKYKKWTGSTSLGTRFRDNVLSDPKGFTKRAFHDLYLQQQELLATLRAASPGITEPNSPASSPSPVRRDSSGTSRSPNPLAQPPQQVYWNEYDNGSEAGDYGKDDDEYAIYCNPDEETSFPVFSYLGAVFTTPLDKVRKLWSSKDPDSGLTFSSEQQPLTRSSHRSYSATATHTDTEAEDEYASSGDDLPYAAYLPRSGYAAHYAALPSIEEQRVSLYRESVLRTGTTLSLFASYVLLLVAGILMASGKHKLRAEVDAGVIVGVVASLFCSCLGLGMMMYRQDKLGLAYQAIVWIAFTAVCVVNGMLLVLVVGNSPV